MKVQLYIKKFTINSYRVKTDTKNYLKRDHNNYLEVGKKCKDLRNFFEHKSVSLGDIKKMLI